MNVLLQSAPPAILEAICTFELMRLLQVPPEQLRVRMVPPHFVVVVVGRPDGQAEHVVPCGPVGGSWTRQGVRDRIFELVRHMSEQPEAALDGIWQRSRALRDAPKIAFGLLAAGIEVPALVGHGTRTDAAIRKLVDATARAS